MSTYCMLWTCRLQAAAPATGFSTGRYQVKFNEFYVKMLRMWYKLGKLLKLLPLSYIFAGKHIFTNEKYIHLSIIQVLIVLHTMTGYIQ